MTDLKKLEFVFVKLKDTKKKFDSSKLKKKLLKFKKSKSHKEYKEN